MIDPSNYLGKPVESLQVMLREISNYYPEVLPVIPNGSFDRNTYASIVSFQQMYGITPSGEATPETWSAISSVYNKIHPKQKTPSIYPIWPTFQILNPGEANLHVFLAQGMLVALSQFFPKQEKPELTGILDPATQAGVRSIQTASGLEPTGILDTQTWYYLSHLYRTMVGSG